MKIKKFPLMIAEEGQANQGNFNLAMRMIELAAESGADGIEFQFAVAEDLYVKRDPGYGIYSKRRFSDAEIRRLIKSAKSKKIIFQSTCLSPALVNVCVKSGADTLCINSMDINNPDMLDAAGKAKIFFWLATLMSTLKEIDRAVDYLRRRGALNFGILHGQHTMASSRRSGVEPEIMQLDCIKMLKKRYALPVGFVDHTPDICAPAIAFSKGADLVTKHLAPGAKWRGPDWRVCLKPGDWKKSYDIFRYAVSASGSSKDLSRSEIKDRKALRRSIFTSRDLKKGDVLKKNDLAALRPGGGMEPMGMEGLVGKKINVSIKKHCMVKKNNLE